MVLFGGNEAEISSSSKPTANSPRFSAEKHRDRLEGDEGVHSVGQLAEHLLEAEHQQLDDELELVADHTHVRARGELLR